MKDAPYPNRTLDRQTLRLLRTTEWMDNRQLRLKQQPRLDRHRRVMRRDVRKTVSIKLNRSSPPPTPTTNRQPRTVFLRQQTMVTLRKWAIPSLYHRFVLLRRLRGAEQRKLGQPNSKKAWLYYSSSRRNRKRNNSLKYRQRRPLILKRGKPNLSLLQNLNN